MTTSANPAQRRRHRERELEDAHHALMDWAQWWIRHVQQSPIGYPGSTVEAKMGRGWLDVDMHPVRGAIAPDVAMSAYIRIVDRSVRDMPAELREVVEVRYELTSPEPHDGGKRPEMSDARCRKALGMSEREWAARVDRVLAWVAAYRAALRHGNIFL